MRQRDEEALDKLIPISDYPKIGYFAGLHRRAERLVDTPRRPKGVGFDHEESCEVA